MDATSDCELIGRIQIGISRILCAEIEISQSMSVAIPCELLL